VRSGGSSHGPVGYSLDMRTFFLRTSALAATLVTVTALSGCGSSSTDSTTTTKPGSPATTTASDLPATGSVDGLILQVTSSPRTGTVGSTTIKVTATLKGTVGAATLHFQVSNAPSASQGQPATDQSVKVTGPGTFTMPKPYSPTKAGNWAVTVTYVPNDTGNSTLSVSGLPPVSGSKPPFPQLVTDVTS